MNGDQHNGEALARPAAATADGEAINGLVTSNDLPTNSVSQEVRENADQSAKFSISELDQLVKRLELSGEKCTTLMKALKEKDIVEKNIDVHVYENLENVAKFFHVEGRTMRVKDLTGLFTRLNIDYSDPSEWILYIIHLQAYKELDCYLVHVTGQEESVEFIRASEVNDPFEFLKQALEASGYEEHRWVILGDFSAKLWQYFEYDKPAAAAAAARN